MSRGTCHPVDDQHLAVTSCPRKGFKKNDLAREPPEIHKFCFIWWEFTWKKDEKEGGAYCQLPIASLSGPSALGFVRQCDTRMQSQGPPKESQVLATHLRLFHVVAKGAETHSSWM